MNKRTENTQGVEFKYDFNNGNIKVLQLNDKKRFILPYDSSLDVLESIEKFLNSIEEIESFSLVINNTSKIEGYLISIDNKGHSFLNLKNYL